MEPVIQVYGEVGLRIEYPPVGPVVFDEKLGPGIACRDFKATGSIVVIALSRSEPETVG